MRAIPIASFGCARFPTWTRASGRCAISTRDRSEAPAGRAVEGEADTAVRFRPPLLAITYFNGIEPNVDAIDRAGGAIVAAFETETSPNTYPRLPVREDVRAVVLLTCGIAPENLPSRNDADVVELVPTKRSRIQLACASGCTEWDTFAGRSWSFGAHQALDERNAQGVEIGNHARGQR